MSGYGEPDWVNPGNTAPDSTQVAETGGNITAPPQ